MIFDRPDFYYEDNGDVFRVNAVTSAISPLPHITDSGSKLAIVSDATNLYTVNAGHTLLRIPKNGTSPHAIVPITGIPTDFVSDLFVTPTTLGGIAVHVGGSCQTTTYTMWSGPIGGGAAKVVSTFTGYISPPVVSGEYVYWGENGCLISTTPDRIMRRRADGSDSPLVMHSAHPLQQVKLFGDHIYWTDGLLHRIPK